MNHALRAARTLLIPVLLGISLSACALGRSEVMVTPPVSAMAASLSAPAVKIVDVRDLRQFTPNPRDPSEPSIGELSEINDPRITSRLIGRKRGGYGNAMGDVAFPEGTTVQSLVSSAAQAALQNKGYRVVGETSSDYAQALPLALDIEKYWSWLNFGAFSGSVNTKATIVMKGEPVSGSPATAEMVISSSEVVATEAIWSRVIQTGLDELTTKMAEKIRPASELRR